MARFKRKLQKEREVKIIYNKGIVEDIVVLALQNVPYIELNSRSTNNKLAHDAVYVEYNKDNVFIYLEVKIHYTQNVSDMAFKVQEIVRHDVEAMTEYKVSEVNITVKDVLFENSVQTETVITDKQVCQDENEIVQTVEDNTQTTAEN